jgi:DNA-directed RNA polymerase subunit K/omega
MPEVCTIQTMTALVIARANQLSTFASPLISEEEMRSVNYDIIRIAEMEIKRGLVHFTTHIKKPNGEYTVTDTTNMLFY